MEYTIDIIDTTDDTHVTAFEFAEAGSLILRWNGSDTKDGQFIIGSSFEFTLEVHVSRMADGYFRHLFTGDESKYRVEIYLTDTPSVIVWTGFLLPDRYSEPYTNGTFYPSFEASDGLGRLKGKYLPDEYYEKEYSVIEYISQCLLLTGLGLPVSLSAAIENVSVKNYKDIYLIGTDFTTTSKKMDAYAILQDVLESMLCVLYQSDNQWWVEGLNKRHLQTVSFYNYEADGTYLNLTKKLKIIKAFNGLNVPLIDVVAPYKIVTVTHDRSPQSLPTAIAQESNDGWAVGQGVSADIKATYWYGNNEFYAIAKAPDYKVSLPTLFAPGFNSTKYIDLKEKIYVNQFDKLVFTSKYKSSVTAKDGNSTINNGMRLVFLLNGTELYSVDRIFETDNLEINFDLFINQPGLLDLKILQPYWEGTEVDGTYADLITIEEMVLEVTGFNDELIATDIINGDFSETTEIELPIADDATAFSKSFRLSKLNVIGSEYNTVAVPVLYGFLQNAKFYSVVSLYGANLISDNIDTVYYNNVLLTGLSVTYNHQNGEQMVVQTPQAINSGEFQVRIYKNEDYTQPRTTWQQWTDAIYPIESDRYHESAAKVYRRMFINAHERVTYTADNAYKFNDLVRFNYYLPANYFITDLSWNLDKGFSDITMIKCVYQNEVVEIGGGDNVPPLVNAGEDVVLPDDFGTYDPSFGYLKLYHNTPTAFDPDGFIVTYFWEVESGDQDAVINGKDLLHPTLVRFNGNVLTLRLTVKDNDGATAFDTVTFTRVSALVIDIEEDLHYNTDNNLFNGTAYKRDLIAFTPDLEDTVAVTIKGNYYLKNEDIDGSPVLQGPTTSFVVNKNGVDIIRNEAKGIYGEEQGNFEFNYIKDDVIKIEVRCYTPTSSSQSNDYIQLTAGYTINEVIFQQGSGNANGLPLSQEVQYSGPGD